MATTGLSVEHSIVDMTPEDMARFLRRLRRWNKKQIAQYISGLGRNDIFKISISEPLTLNTICCPNHFYDNWKSGCKFCAAISLIKDQFGRLQIAAADYLSKNPVVSYETEDMAQFFQETEQTEEA